MVIVEGWVKFEPGEIEKALDAARTLVAATRQEDGCIHYSMARDLIDPDCIRISERWRDDDALAGHFKQPHMAAFGKVTGELKRAGADVRKYAAEEVAKLI